MITDEELAAIRNHMDVVRYDDDLLPNVLVDDMLRLLDEIERLRSEIRWWAGTTS